MSSYAALGLLPSIPVAKDLSGSKSYRAKLDLPIEQGLKIGYGKIVRDDEGNVVDVITPDDDGREEQAGSDDVEMENDEEEETAVQGKTDIVRCESLYARF